MEQKTFAFNFLSEETQKIPSPTLKEEPATASALQQAQEKPFLWVHNLDELLKERSQEELVYNDIPINTEMSASITDSIRQVDLNLSSYRKASKSDTTEYTLNPPVLPKPAHEADIVSGIYEGGNKVWECSLDLVEYLSTSLDCNQENAHGLPARTWELGCGHGLPGCYLLHKWIVQRRRQDNWSLVFTDFNEEVILDATISNILLNSCIGVTQNDNDDDDGKTPISVKDVTSHVKLGYGDWKDHSRQMMDQEDGTFDLILAAETLYTEQASKETADLLVRHLDPSKGVAFVATKRYYFGVGGGVDCFRAHATGLLIDSVKVIDNGTGNIREILRVTVA